MLLIVDQPLMMINWLENIIMENQINNKKMKYTIYYIVVYNLSNIYHRI